jgi:aldehyde dehydrogenase (NAD+)
MTAEPRFTQSAVGPEIDRIYALQQKRREEIGRTTAAQRIEKLRNFEKAMLSSREEIRAALWADFGRLPAEVDLSDIYPVVSEARHARRHLRKWMKPRRVSTPLSLLGSRSQIVYEPKGLVLIIAPWNFPFNLTLGPLVSAVAAGNCAIVKPSELTPSSSACMKRILAGLFDESEVAVIEGEGPVAAALLERRFDHIFFTGSTRVGRIVMKAAAEHLTSVTLELGGKSPVIVDRTANLDEAAKKIAWGKTLNAGQVCIAPDYLLVDESIRAPFLERLRKQMDIQGAPGARTLVVNSAHAARIKSMFDSATAHGATVYSGGKFDGRDISPTILEGVRPDEAVMQEEIFGPLLPVFPYRDLDEALRFIAGKEKPLVLYVFSRNKSVVQKVMSGTSAGGTAVNETVIHFNQTNLPFGGVGESGVGKSHGFFGFEAFSNARGVLEQPTRWATIQLMYPPYTKLKQKLIDLTLKYF